MDKSGVTSLNIEDHAALRRYLLASGRIEPDEVVRLDTLAGGVSNRTVRVERADGVAWVLKQALHKLRVRVDWFSDPARVHREALGIRWLSRLAPGAVPPLIFEDQEHHLLAMAAVPQPHENWKQRLLQGRGEQEEARQFGTLLGSIHASAAEHAEPLRTTFADRSFFESLRLEPYYLYAASQCPDAAAFLHELVAGTAERSITLVHGDYSPKNILVHEKRLWLLDHEVIHWGDPAFDVGFSLTHLLSKAHHLPEHREALRAMAAAHVAAYFEVVASQPWAAALMRHAVAHTLGCMLARVCGRSTLEYLTADQRQAQQQAVLAMMAAQPRDLSSLIDRFLEQV